MIIPNLMVTDMARSVAFYRDKLGLAVDMSVGADRSFAHGGEIADNAVFTVLAWDGAQLMLQTVASLAGDVPAFSADQTPSPGGTVYFRGFDPDTVAGNLSADEIVKGPETSWYGMRELYVRDPDGHIICLGAPDGAAPEG